MLTLFALLACGGADPVAQAPAAEAPAAPAAQAPAAEATAEGWSSFGSPIVGTEVLAARDLLAAPQSFSDRTVLVEGRVADVCSKKGCWMVLTDPAGGEQMMRVTMKDHAWGLPLDCTGQAIQLEGQVVSKAVDPATVEHYQSEARKPELTPEAQAQSGVSWELVATGARLKAL